MYDDPKSVTPEAFRFDICGTVTKQVPENDYGVFNKVMQGGKCAWLRHQGAYEGLSEKVRYLYSQWLPSSGEELRDFPCFFEYVKRLPDVEEHMMITDIYLPLK